MKHVKTAQFQNLRRKLSLLNIYKPPMNCRAPNHCRISWLSGKLPQPTQLQPKTYSVLKIRASHHKPPPPAPPGPPAPLAWPGPTVWLERGCGTFCSVFSSLVPHSVQLYHWYEVPLGRPASLVEIPREKFSETLPPFALGERLISTGDFSAPSDVDLMFYWV